MPSSRSHNDASSAQQAMKEVYAESQLYLTIKGYFRQPTEEESWDKDIIATPKMEMLLQRDDREQYLPDEWSSNDDLEALAFFASQFEQGNKAMSYFVTARRALTLDRESGRPSRAAEFERAKTHITQMVTGALGKEATDAHWRDLIRLL